MLQGSNRLQRGINWFYYNKANAGDDFKWKMDHFNGGHNASAYLNHPFLTSTAFGA